MGGSVWGIILDVWMMSKTLFWVGGGVGGG